ncbi:MAG: alpha/beta hydrolase [bacterium]|nr:alpha/beta hydrolase [bacterium]
MLLDKSQERQIAVNTTRVFYRTAGEGPVVLVLHGWGRGSVAYIKVMEALAQQGYQVVIPDLPGFGNTEPPKSAWGTDEYAKFAFEFSQKLGLAKFYLLGHSFGGQVAVSFATDHPQQVQKLILYAAAVIRREPAESTKKIQVVARIGNAVFSLPLLSILQSPLRKLFYRLFGISDAAYSNGIMKEVREKVVRQDLSHLLSKISCPVLLIWGDKDKSTPVEDSELIQKKIPHATRKVLSETTHLLHREVPQSFVQALLTFLES